MPPFLGSLSPVGTRMKIASVVNPHVERASVMPIRTSWNIPETSTMRRTRSTASLLTSSSFPWSAFPDLVFRCGE